MNQQILVKSTATGRTTRSPRYFLDNYSLIMATYRRRRLLHAKQEDRLFKDHLNWIKTCHLF